MRKIIAFFGALAITTSSFFLPDIEVANLDIPVAQVEEADAHTMSGQDIYLICKWWKAYFWGDNPNMVISLWLHVHWWDSSQVRCNFRRQESGSLTLKFLYDLNSGAYAWIN